MRHVGGRTKELSAGRSLLVSLADVVACGFLALVLLIVLGFAIQWWQLVRGTKVIKLNEAEFVSVAGVQVANL